MNIILKSFLITLTLTFFALLLYLIGLLPEFYGLVSLMTLFFVLVWSFVYVLLK